MRLVRYGERGQERPGILDSQGLLRDLSGVVRDIDGAALMPDSLDRLRALDPGSLPEVPGAVRLGACVGSVRNIVCIGLNYSDHAAETNTPIPAQPSCSTSTLARSAGPMIQSSCRQVPRSWTGKWSWRSSSAGPAGMCPKRMR
jgi:2,4-diketo-3-deoxy-L-fuconate hydrolase